MGAKFKAGNGFKIIGGHTGKCSEHINISNKYCSFPLKIGVFNFFDTDSPHLKVKPLSKRGGSGCVQLGVECYGGG